MGYITGIDNKDGNVNFQYYNPSTQSISQLTNALLAANPRLTVDTGSIVLKYGVVFAGSTIYDSRTSVSFYNGLLAGLSIGSGLLLTSGDASPALSNTGDAFGESFIDASMPDADFQAVANSAFAQAGTIRDTSILSFKFNITDPTIKGIRFDLVYGSDEYPEFVNSPFVDIAAVFINGINYALFNGSADQPLSIIEKNLNIGNFTNNINGALPIEYDGVSRVLSIVAPVRQGENSIKIGVADTGDDILDSGLFISNLQGVGFSGFGLAPVLVQLTSSQLENTDQAGNQLYTFANGAKSQITFTDTPGSDVVDAVNAFVTASFTFATSKIKSYTFANNVLELVTANGIKQLADVERIKFPDALYAFDTAKGEDTWQAYALLKAGFGKAPDKATLSQWVKQADDSPTMAALAQKLLDFYAPGISADALVQYLYGTLAGIKPTQAQIQEFSSQVGVGQTFGTTGDLFAFAAGLNINTNTFLEIVGSIQTLDVSYF